MYMKHYIVKSLTALMLFFLFFTKGWSIDLRGKVIDRETGEPLVGATLSLPQIGRTTLSDNDGLFTFQLPAQRNYTLTAQYLGYRKQTLTVNPARTDTLLLIYMESATDELGTAVVTATRQKSTETAAVTIQQHSMVVQSGIAGQQIRRTQDKDAGEVIRRVPGISLIDQKFVMVRGLSQRYNNVWINGSSVPCSEPDTRAFSFDIIPSSQIDNLQIIKSPAPEYPADFSGGFILIDTKEVPGVNTTSVSLSAAVNDQTHWQAAQFGQGGGLAWLGFPGSNRQIPGGIKGALQQLPNSGVSLLDNGFDNDWRVRTVHPAADCSFALDLNRSIELGDGALLSVLAALNYSNAYKTYTDMENSLFGAYDLAHDRSNYLRHSTDQQYNHDVRLGALLNLTFLPSRGTGRYEWKNIFNQLGKERFTSRTGVNAQSDNEVESEYYYSSRSTYNTQLTGKYVWSDSRFDWNAGYAYANRNLPDRHRYTLDDALGSGIQLTTGNEVNREYTRLDEHIGSASVNYQHRFEDAALRPTLFGGAFGEYRTRKYQTRSFIYAWDPAHNTLPTDFQTQEITSLLSNSDNFGESGLYLLDDTHMTDDYEGNQFTAAAYASANLNLGPLGMYAGLRYERNRMELISNTRDYERSPLSHFYDADGLFPSVNFTLHLPRKQQLRACYGRSINRAEFREVSASVFYDFDLASAVQGNPDLRPCYTDNVDLRYEFYPTEGEQISVAAFYKHFDNPIEWTYTVAGGTDLVYSFQNAKGAYSYGLELDVRKRLDLIGLPDFTLVCNGSLIKSRVQFADRRLQKNRPMQGQSPYLINLGLFYSHKAWNATALYNRIGKRLIGVGRSLGSTGDQTVNIPDSYEMPRNSLDLGFSYTLKSFTFKVGCKDILGEHVLFKQFNDVQLPTGEHKKVEEITRRYLPGRTFSLGVSWKL